MICVKHFTFEDIRDFLFFRKYIRLYRCSFLKIFTIFIIKDSINKKRVFVRIYFCKIESLEGDRESISFDVGPKKRPNLIYQHNITTDTSQNIEAVLVVH